MYLASNARNGRSWLFLLLLLCLSPGLTLAQGVDQRFTFDWKEAATKGFVEELPYTTEQNTFINTSVYETDPFHGFGDGSGTIPAAWQTQTISDIAGSGVDLTLQFSVNPDDNFNNQGPNLYGSLGGPNPDCRVTGDFTLRMVNDKTPEVTPFTAVFTFSEAVNVNEWILGSLSRVVDYENVVVRAFSGPNGTGTVIPATSYQNISDLSDDSSLLHGLGNAGCAVRDNQLANVNLDPVSSGNTYHVLGIGSQDLDKYGRVKWAWDGQTIQSIAVSGWTTEAPSFTDRDYTTSVLSFFVAPVTFSTHTADPEFDFGDLPDGIGNVDYPTLLASNGPRHTIVDQCFLGQGIDAEGDAQTSLDAEGDDIAGTDDEDGVTFGDAQWTPGTTTNITLAVNRLGCLDAAASCWADFNGDGDFNDAGENIISGVSSGTYAVDVPNSVTGGAVAVRCRLASDAGLTPVGAASDGEVEDYFQPVASLDYGDLGTNDNGTDYPTLFADSGPRHVIVSECLLGQAIDAEADGQPDANAEGDDNAGTDDEDGIQFLTGQIDEGQTERLAATGITTGCAEALLYCWADFNDDASFNDEEELIVNAQPLSASPFEYTVPEEIASTSIGVRCRLSNDAAAASPTGTAPNGEVEDYTVESSLPVELSAFELEPLGSRVALTWSTLTETNNAGFEIQTNHNGSGFEALSFVDGVGTTVEAQSYTWTSGDLQPGIYQFRLKQIDFDGQFAYSPVVEAVIGVPDQAILEPAYPNPFNPTTNIRFTVADRADVAVWLYDTTGRQVRQLFEGQVEAGRTQAISVDATDLPSGVYLIRLEGPDFTESQKVMLMK